MKKTIITILATLVICLGGYLVYDKFISNDNEVGNNKENNNFDLAFAEELIDKYILLGLGENLFEQGLTEEMKMLIAMQKVSFSYVSSHKCENIYGDYQDSNGEYIIPGIGFCYDNADSIGYIFVNKIYKSLFGEEMPKKDIILGIRRFDYIEEMDDFISLRCNCGGVDPDLKIYGVKNANLIDSELIINVGYSRFSSSDNFTIYSADFDQTIKYSGDQINNNENIEKEIFAKYSDRMDSYKFIFTKTNNGYILKDMVKE